MLSLYRFPSTSTAFDLKSTPIVAVVSSSERYSSSVNLRRRDDLPRKHASERDYMRNSFSVGLTDTRVANQQQLKVCGLFVVHLCSFDRRAQAQERSRVEGERNESCELWGDMIICFCHELGGKSQTRRHNVSNTAERESSLHRGVINVQAEKYRLGMTGRRDENDAQLLGKVLGSSVIECEEKRLDVHDAPLLSSLGPRGYHYQVSSGSRGVEG